MQMWQIKSMIKLTFELKGSIRQEFLGILPQINCSLGRELFTACVVYTKTIFFLNVGESDEYLPPFR